MTKGMALFNKEPFDLLRNFIEFSDTSFNNSATYPPHNIYMVGEDNKKLYFEFALAGFKKTDVSINIEDGNVLCVSGKKDKIDEKRDYIKRNLASREFVAKFAISNSFDILSPNAEFKDGVLRISFNEKKEEKKMIEIK